MFGFISFRNVRDVNETERALNGTKMGNSKLRVNVAKFASENANLLNNEYAEKLKDPVYEHGIGTNQYQIKSQAFVQGGGKLFKDLFSNDNGSKACSSSMVAQEEKVVEAPEGTLAFQDMIGKVLVGRCVDLVTLNMFNSRLSGWSFTFERIAWIKLLGVPVHLASDSVYLRRHCWQIRKGAAWVAKNLGGQRFVC
ncbi:putative nucleotide-binding alpha-beta plait domain superfamily, RNA-binding domain superfamily [Helianthus anomalus]